MKKKRVTDADRVEAIKQEATRMALAYEDRPPASFVRGYLLCGSLRVPAKGRHLWVRALYETMYADRSEESEREFDDWYATQVLGG